MYFTGGKCKVINASHDLSVQSGDLVVIQSGTMHRVIAKDSGCTYILLQIDAHYWESVGFPLSNTTIEKQICDKDIGKLLEQALSEQTEQLPYFQENVKALIQQVLVILFRKYLVEDFRTNDHSGKAKLVKQLAEYIFSHCHEDLTVDAISRAFGYSRFYISKIFKEVTNVTITHYINASRVERAKSLIKNANLSVSEIAMQCGFMSQSYFSKVFKRFENVSPQEYRARIRR